MRISDGSSDVCSSDLPPSSFPPSRREASLPASLEITPMTVRFKGTELRPVLAEAVANQCRVILVKDQGVYFLAECGERRPDGRQKTIAYAAGCNPDVDARSEEHTSELQTLMRISYAVLFLKKIKHI